MKRYLFLTLLVFTGFLAGFPSAQGLAEIASLQGLGPLNPAEKWVLEKVSAGDVAELREKFGNEERPRHLRGRFLEALLSDKVPGLKVHYRGVAIKHAIISDYLDLRSVEAPQAVELSACRFLSGVNFNFGAFKKYFSLDQSQFVGWAFFNGLKVDGDFSFEWRGLHRGRIFRGGERGGEFSGQRGTLCQPGPGS